MFKFGFHWILNFRLVDKSQCQLKYKVTNPFNHEGTYL